MARLDARARRPRRLRRSGHALSVRLAAPARARADPPGHLHHRLHRRAAAPGRFHHVEETGDRDDGRPERRGAARQPPRDLPLRPAGVATLRALDGLPVVRDLRRRRHRPVAGQPGPLDGEQPAGQRNPRRPARADVRDLPADHPRHLADRPAHRHLLRRPALHARRLRAHAAGLCRHVRAALPARPGADVPQRGIFRPQRVRAVQHALRRGPGVDVGQGR